MFHPVAGFLEKFWVFPGPLSSDVTAVFLFLIGAVFRFGPGSPFRIRPVGDEKFPFFFLFVRFFTAWSDGVFSSSPNRNDSPYPSGSGSFLPTHQVLRFRYPCPKPNFLRLRRQYPIHWDCRLKLLLPFGLPSIPPPFLGFLSVSPRIPWSSPS